MPESPTHSLPELQTPTVPGAPPRVHKWDQMTSPDRLRWSIALFDIRANASQWRGAASAHSSFAPPSSQKETAGRALGKSPTLLDDSAPGAAPPPATFPLLLRPPAPAGPHSVPPTIYATSTCCAPPKWNTSPAPNQTSPRHPRAPRLPQLPPGNPASFGLGFLESPQNCPHPGAASL